MSQAHEVSGPPVQVARAIGKPPRRTAAWLVIGLLLLGLCSFLFVLYQLVGYRSFYIPSGAMEPTLMGPASSGTSGDRIRVEMLFSPLRSPRRGEIWVFRAPPQASPDEKEFIKRVIGLPGETVEIVAPRLFVDGKPALKLTPDEGSVRLVMVEGGVPGSVAHLRVGYADTDCTVVADPRLQLTVRPDRVLVNGKVQLEDKSGHVRELPQGLIPYGARSNVRGRVFTVGIDSFNADPRLIVVQGRELKHDPGHVLCNGKRLVEPYIAEEPHYSMPRKRLGPREFFMMGDNRNNSNDSHMWGPLTRDRFEGKAVYRFWPPERVGGL